MSFGKYLKSLRERKGFSVRQLALLAGISNGYLSQVETGQRGTPSPEILKKLAKPLGVSYEELLRAAGYLSASDRAGVSDSVTVEHRREDGTVDIRQIPGAWPVGETVRVPILGVIRAGEPIYAEQNIEGYEEVPKEWVNGQECFFLRVTGDSMSGARIQEGDLVFVRRQDYAENGDIVVAIVNGQDATIKRIFFTGDAIILHPENPRYKPLVLQGEQRDDVRIIGKVLWFKGMVG
ncbi:MAG: transcriptional repressor LexA [Bacillota bacterium]